jgi:hypothetical protein
LSRNWLSWVQALSDAPRAFTLWDWLIGGSVRSSTNGSLRLKSRVRLSLASGLCVRFALRLSVICGVALFVWFGFDFYVMLVLAMTSFCLVVFEVCFLWFLSISWIDWVQNFVLAFICTSFDLIFSARLCSWSFGSWLIFVDTIWFVSSKI